MKRPPFRPALCYPYMTIHASSNTDTSPGEPKPEDVVKHAIDTANDIIAATDTLEAWALANNTGLLHSLPDDMNSVLHRTGNIVLDNFSGPAGAIINEALDTLASDMTPHIFRLDLHGSEETGLPGYIVATFTVVGHKDTLTVLLYLRTSRDKEGNPVFSLGRYADMRPSISVSTGCRWQDQALTNSFSSLAIAQLENIIKIPETISNKDVDAACKRVMSYQSTM